MRVGASMKHRCHGQCADRRSVHLRAPRPSTYAATAGVSKCVRLGGSVPIKPIDIHGLGFP